MEDALSVTEVRHRHLCRILHQRHAKWFLRIENLCQIISLPLHLLYLLLFLNQFQNLIRRWPLHRQLLSQFVKLVTGPIGQDVPCLHLLLRVGGDKLFIVDCLLFIQLKPFDDFFKISMRHSSIKHCLSETVFIRTAHLGGSRMTDSSIPLLPLFLHFLRIII